jgi:RecA/RadA recombinase
MHDNKRRRFDSAVAGLQQRHGAQVLVPAHAVNTRPAAIATGFSRLDVLLEIGGVPLNAVSVLSGPCTSGKLTLGYKILGHAQQPATGFPSAARPRVKAASQPHSRRQEAGFPPASLPWARRETASQQPSRTVVIVDLHDNTDPDYLARCGIRLDYLLLARPRSILQAIELLLDIVRSGQARAILLDSLAGEKGSPHTARAAYALLPQLRQLLSQSGCALILLDQPYPLWQRWVQRLTGSSLAAQADLHVEVQHERWLERAVQIYGYQAQVKVLRNRWGRSGMAASIAIEFNGTVKARETL